MTMIFQRRLRKSSSRSTGYLLLSSRLRIIASTMISNAYTRWKSMGSPQSLMQTQRAELERAEQLELLEPPKRLTSAACPC